jgi:hypothetical protein
MRIVRVLRPLLAASAAALALAASGVDEPRAIVAVAYDGIAQQVHPVLIQAVDGKQQVQPLRDTLWLAPGKHTLRLAARLDDNAVRLRGPVGARAAAPAVLELEVEAGKRYLIGAKVDGRRGVDWKPVVLRVEDVGG